MVKWEENRSFPNNDRIWNRLLLAIGSFIHTLTSMRGVTYLLQPKWFYQKKNFMKKIL